MQGNRRRMDPSCGGHVRRSRRGVTMLEFAVVLPAFTALTMGVGELSHLLTVRQSLSSILHQTGRLCSAGSLTQDELIDMIEQKASDVVAQEAMEIKVLSVTSPETVCGTDCHVPTRIEDVRPGESFLLQVTVPFSEASWMQPVFCSGVDITVQVMIRHE